MDVPIASQHRPDGVELGFLGTDHEKALSRLSSAPRDWRVAPIGASMQCIPELARAAAQRSVTSGSMVLISTMVVPGAACADQPVGSQNDALHFDVRRKTGEDGARLLRDPLRRRPLPRRLAPRAHRTAERAISKTTSPKPLRCRFGGHRAAHPPPSPMKPIRSMHVSPGQHPRAAQRRRWGAPGAPEGQTASRVGRCVFTLAGRWARPPPHRGGSQAVGRNSRRPGAPRRRITDHNVERKRRKIARARPSATDCPETRNVSYFAAAYSRHRQWHDPRRRAHLDLLRKK